MTEQSGRLEAAVEAYLDGEQLTPAALDLIKESAAISRARADGRERQPWRAAVGAVGARYAASPTQRLAEELSEYGVEPFNGKEHREHK